jgi:two-component system response regulator AtoC
MAHEYPGNIRELKSIIMSALNLSRGTSITVQHLPDDIQKKAYKKQKPASSVNSPLLSLQEMEKRYILDVYNQKGKNKSQTARVLGIALNTLRNKLDAYET